MPNRITRSIAPKSIFEDSRAVLSSTADYEQGDLLIFDDTLNVIRKPASEAECATLLGIAPQSVTDGRVVGPYTTAVDAAQAIVPIQGPVFSVIVRLILKTGDTVAPGDVLYADPASGAANVSVAGTKAIGVYQGAAITSAPAGTEVELLLGSRFPGDSLKF